MIKHIFFMVALLGVAFSAAANTQSVAGYAAETTGGSAYAFNNQGEKRKLEEGTPIFEGETLITDDGATSSLVFTDGTFIELEPKTQFRIEEYQFGEDPSASNGVFRMLKGGFGFLTGLLNKNGGSMEFKTPTATIGVRGTGGRITADLVEIYIGQVEYNALNKAWREGDTAKAKKIINISAGTSYDKKSGKIKKIPVSILKKKLAKYERRAERLRAKYAKRGHANYKSNALKKAENKIKVYKAILNAVPGGGGSTSAETASQATAP